MATVNVTMDTLPSDAPSHNLSSELDTNDATMAVDFRDVIKQALRLAELQSWYTRLKCPDGKKRTVKQIVKMFNHAYEAGAYFDFR